MSNLFLKCKKLRKPKAKGLITLIRLLVASNIPLDAELISALKI